MFYILGIGRRKHPKKKKISDSKSDSVKDSLAKAKKNAKNIKLSLFLNPLITIQI